MTPTQLAGYAGLDEYPVNGPHPDAARMAHFLALDQGQQRQAIARLALLGQSPHTIARATGLPVEIVQRILAESRPA
jgi:hypothetical protein